MRRLPLLLLLVAPLCACTELTAPRGEDPNELGQLPQNTITASHILIAYQGARGAPAKVTRTKDEARALAEKLALQAKTGDFDELAQAHSDHAGSASNGGRLGQLRRHMMGEQFSDAAFALAVGQTSGAVETEFGFHVIKRTK